MVRAVLGTRTTVDSMGELMVMTGRLVIQVKLRCFFPPVVVAYPASSLDSSTFQRKWAKNILFHRSLRG